jgi:hypothetical protein
VGLQTGWERVSDPSPSEWVFGSPVADETGDVSISAVVMDVTT